VPTASSQDIWSLESFTPEQFSTLPDGSPDPTDDSAMQARTAGIITIAGATSFLAMAVLAFWPTPGKYPWALPVAAVACVLVAAYRRYLEADGDSAYLLAIGFVAVFSGMTLLDVGHRHDLPTAAIIAVVVGLAVFPLAAFLLALIASGSADYPYDD
jgi:hypothetical protein